MLTKYNELVEPTQLKALEALGISKSMVCKILRERENAVLLPAPILVGRKMRNMQNDEEVDTALKPWLELIQSRFGRISGVMLKEKV
ncbi:hypothetical protein MXB_1757 [Myxobolus squamalis]|nr:hypothetical protein MXB_1757 [Myxobolus squamalis]